MRALIVTVAVSFLAAAAPEPQRIALTRVFPGPGQIGLFIAAADGSDERPLLAVRTRTTMRRGRPTAPRSSSRPSATAPRICIASSRTARRSSDSPTIRRTTIRRRSRPTAGNWFRQRADGGTADLWTMDLQTRRARALTSGTGGDFRPSWSPDGNWIAFSSDRASNLPFAHGRWEHLHLVDLYIVHPDGVGSEADHRARRLLRQPEVGGRQPARRSRYCMTAEQTLDNRRREPEHPGRTRGSSSVDIASGASSDVPAGPGVKFNPSMLRGDASPTSAGTAPRTGHSLLERHARSERRRADRGVVARRHARRVSQARDVPAASLGQDLEPQSRVRADAHRRRAVVQPGRRSLRDSSGRPQKAIGAGVGVAASAATRAQIIYQDKARNILGPQWSPSGDAHHLRHRRVQRVLQRFPRPVPEAGGSRRKAARRSRWSIPTAAGSAS